MFREILDKLQYWLQRYETNFRKTIDPGHRLVICLRYLATGETFRSLSFQFRVSHNPISQIVMEVCEAIIEEYHEEVMPSSLSVDYWRAKAEGFEKWNFPHCTCAIDGKHVAIVCPKKSGSQFYNYKKIYSIILLGIVDTDYKFVYIDAGCNGSSSDTQVFNRSAFKKAVKEHRVGWPAPDPLPNDDGPTLYFMVGDDACPLKTWLMKPYSKRQLTKEERVFNYRLSRARRVSENAFRILVHRFRCLLKTIEVQPEEATSITIACCMLHNLMRMRYPDLDRGQSDQVNIRGQII